MNLELIANMLGVRREGVTQGAQAPEGRADPLFARPHHGARPRRPRKAAASAMPSPNMTARCRTRRPSSVAAPARAARRAMRWHSQRGRRHGHSAFDAERSRDPPANQLIERLPRRDRARLLARCTSFDLVLPRCLRAGRAHESYLLSHRRLRLAADRGERHARLEVGMVGKVCSGHVASGVATAPQRAPGAGSRLGPQDRMAHAAPSWRKAPPCARPRSLQR
jgi:hypothetical protein